MRKKVIYYTDKELAGLRWLSRMIDFGVSLTIYSAINELYTAHMMLRERRDLYRQNVKRYANETIEAAKLKQKQQLLLMTNKNFFNAYSDKAIDLAAGDITMFRISIKQTLDDANYKDSDLISYIETARALLDAARHHFCTMVDTAANDYSEAIPSMSKSLNKIYLKKKWTDLFAEFNVDNVLKSWDRLCNALYPSSEDINLNTPRSTKIFDSLCLKFANGDYVEACLHEAHEVEPEFTENHILLRKN